MRDQRCEANRERVSSFVDEQLAGPELLALEAHLEACPECRQFDSDLRRFPDLLRAAEAFRPLRQPPPGFAAQVAARVVAGGWERVVAFPAPAAARRSRAARVGFAAAAAAAALFFAWSWQRLLPGESPEQRLVVRPPASVGLAAADTGDMESWLRRHATFARGATLLGPAEEVDVAVVRPAAWER